MISWPGKLCPYKIMCLVLLGRHYSVVYKKIVWKIATGFPLKSKKHEASTFRKKIVFVNFKSHMSM